MTAPLLRDLLPQCGEQRVRAAAVALDDRGKLLTVGHLHADAIDIDVGNQPAAAAVNHMPIHFDRAAAAPLHLARHDRLLTVRPAAGHAERFAAVLAQALGIGYRQVVAEQAHELLVLLRAEPPAGRSENELRSALQIEIAAEDAAEHG